MLYRDLRPHKAQRCKVTRNIIKLCNNNQINYIKHKLDLF